MFLTIARSEASLKKNYAFSYILKSMDKSGLQLVSSATILPGYLKLKFRKKNVNRLTF